MSGLSRLVTLFLLVSSTPLLHSANPELAHLVKPAGPLPGNSQISIQTPDDGRFQDTLAEDSNFTVYENSGSDTVNAFKAAIANHSSSVSLIGECLPEKCLALAGGNGSSHLVMLEILYWEERSTTWSGKPDRLTLEVSVYELDSGLLVARSFMHANSSIGSSSSGKVAGYLPEMADKYVAWLYEE